MARKVTMVLALRDNYTAVIKKTRRFTSAFDKDVQKMTARLDAASKKKYDIRVKSSVAMKSMPRLKRKLRPCGTSWLRWPRTSPTLKTRSSQ